MLGNFLGGRPEPEPDVIVERSRSGGWTTSGPSARASGYGRTLEDVLEVVAANHRGDHLVEVRTGRGAWRATAAQIADDFGREYRDPPPARIDDDRADPFFDYL